MKIVTSWFSARRADALWVMVLFGLSACISWQGWKANLVDDDSVPNIESATRLLSTGTIPSRGDISSHSSFNPPGTVWLYLPGDLLFSDYRLFELPGSLLLHGGTLIGIFILMRLAFTRSAARIAVLLYAFSPIGLFFARSLWPRGHPCFVVWFVILTILWHRRRNTKYLAAALVTLAAGMYVFMEVAPLLLVVVGVYYLYRPPLQKKWVLASALISLLIWLPYLRFENTRGLRDIGSLVFQVDIMPRDHGLLLCDPTLREEMLKQPLLEETIAERARRFVRRRPGALLTGLLTNFRVQGFPYDRQPPSKGESANRPFVVALLRAITLALFGAVAAVMALRGAVYLCRRSRPVPAWNLLPSDTEKIVLLALVVPWAALFLAAEVEARRYLFLWPLQTALLAYSVTDLLARWTSREWMLRAAQVALVVIVVVNPTVLARVEDWRTNGWTGADSDTLRALGFVTEQLHREGRNNAAIGYSIPGNTGDDALQAIDPRYRIGMDADYVLNQRFGVRNLDRCPEGISVVDDYVIAQVGPDWDPPEYVRLRERILSEFQQIGQFGQYVVLSRAKGQDGALSIPAGPLT